MKNTQEKQRVGGILGLIERVGNKIPDITIWFVGAFVLVCVISAILSQMHFDYVHPTTGKNIVVNNMLSGENIVLLMSKMVTNYSGFPPLGMVIVATLGIGIADGSGYINTGLKKLLAVTPKFLLSPIIILAGMLSHIGPDTGYVIIIPVAAYMFYASGKHPLSGIAASFAGIAGAFAANYTPFAIDPVIQGFTQSAAQLIDPTYQVNVLCNYFFAFASTFGVIASFKAPVMQSIVSLLFVFTGTVGLVYGILVGKFKSPKDVTNAMESITKTLVQLIVFYFFAAQFLWAFGASNMGALIAIAGAEFLKSLALPPQITVFGIIVLVGLLNLIITSASAKWAILAPIFVPMLMAVGISPELTQVAFRVSDSAVNVVTPMFAFYPLIILYCQKYCKSAGIGTLSSMMLPYTVALLVTLTIMLYLFWGLDIPLGFQADYVYPRR